VDQTDPFRIYSLFTDKPGGLLAVVGLFNRDVEKAGVFRNENVGLHLFQPGHLTCLPIAVPYIYQTGTGFFTRLPGETVPECNIRVCALEGRAGVTPHDLDSVISLVEHPGQHQSR
jgi:hypothetical protein